MNHYLRFIIFQLVIVTFFLLFNVLRNRISNREKLIHIFIRINLFLLEPFLAFWTGWNITFKASLLWLPAAGISTALATFGLGLILSRFIRETGLRRETFTIASSLSNQGYTMGAFICYVLFGEEGLALTLIYIIYFAFFAYGFIFTYASFKGSGNAEKVSISSLLRRLISAKNLPLYALIAALTLNAAGIERPSISLNLDFIIFPIVILSFSMLGLSYNIRSLNIFSRSAFFLTGIKFVICPLFGLLFVSVFQLPAHYARIIIVESMMPVAVYSVVTANLFKLDSEYAASLFVINTLQFLILFFPLLYIITEYLL
ncbi:MAG: AEC family transporter [Spirochaetes bacterium]|nr:AEC family transporter [Spirochaetota bacterium]